VESGEDFIDNPSAVDGTPVVGIDSLSHINHTKGTAVRKMRAFRTELDFKKFNFGINALKSYDDIKQYVLGYEELYDQYTFLGNAVISTDFTLRLNNKKTQFKGETAISLMNDLRGTSIDTLGEKMDMSDDELNSTKDLFNAIEDLVGFNINSDLIIGSSEGRGISIPLPDMDSLNTNADVLDYMINNMFKQGTYRFFFKTPIEFEQNTFDLQAEYKRVPANFISLGNSSIQTDIQGLKSSIKGRLFKNILSINLGYDNEHDNLMGETVAEKLKSSTSTSITKSGALGINYLDYPSINYSVRVMNRNGQSIKGNGIWDDDEALDDLNGDGIWNEEEEFTDINPITTSNKTITHTISPSFKFKTESDMNVSLGGNIMVMKYNDNLYDASVLTATNTNFTTGSYTGSLGLRFDSPLAFNMGAGLSINSPENINLQPTQFLVITSKLGYKFMEKTLGAFLGINVVSGSKKVDDKGEGGINNSKITMKAGAQYKFENNMSVGLNIDFISLSDNGTPENSFSEFKGKLKFKMGF
jgi:opacity protein-like surface antigen